MDYKRTQMLFRGLTGHAASITLIDAKGSTHAVASGMMGPSNLYLSPARPKTTKSVRAKITNAVATLRHILEGRIIAFEGKQGVYFEKDGSPFFIHKNGSELSVLTGGSIDDPLIVDAITLYDLSSLSGMIETQKAARDFLTAVHTKRSGADLMGMLYYLCDSQYFEGLKIATRDSICTYDNLQPEEIKQAIRTGELRPMEVLDGLPAAALKLDVEVPKMSAEEEKKEDSSSKFVDCKMGAYLLDHVWDIERLDDIQPLEFLDDFVPVPQFFTMVDILNHELNAVLKRMKNGETGQRAIGSNYVNCQLVGRPGTGKTTIANALSAAFGLPVKVVINSKHTEEDTYQGMAKIREGKVDFVSTPFLDAYKTGGIVLLEEFNLCDPGMLMGALGQAIERPFIVYEDGYRIVRRHPLCVIIATANIGTQGSREPSEAMISRMPNIFLLDDPEESDFIAILQKGSSLGKRKIQKVYKGYTKVIDFLCSSSVSADDIALGVTLRACQAAVKQMEIGIPFHDAMKNTVVGAIAVKDIAIAKQTYESVIQSMPE